MPTARAGDRQQFTRELADGLGLGFNNLTLAAVPGVLRISQGTQVEIAQLCVLGDQASDIGRLLGSSERRLAHRVDRYRVRGGN
jgi:hypothetical protein